MDLLEAYNDFALQSTDAPSKYHRYCGAALVGTLLGRRVWYQHGHRMLFPHVWICLIGPSGVKKTTSLGIVEDLVSDLNPELILPSKFSFEALYVALKESAVGVLLYGELHSFLALLGRDFNAEAKSNLADWWDSPASKTHMTKGGGKVSIARPAISILSASTLAWFAETAKSRDISGGFFARMLFTVAEKSDREPMILPPPRDKAKAESIKSGLKDMLGRFQYEMGPQGEMRMTPQAAHDYENAFKDLHREYSPSDVLAPFATRGQVYIIKLAMISAAATRLSLEIRPEDIAYGYDLVRDALRDVAGICEFEIAETKTDGQMNKLRKLLKDAGPKGMTKRDLLKRGPVRREDWLQPLIRSMETMGDIRRVPGLRLDSEVYVYLNGTSAGGKAPQVPQ